MHTIVDKLLQVSGVVTRQDVITNRDVGYRLEEGKGGCHEVPYEVYKVKGGMEEEF